MSKENKICEICNKEFTPNAHNQKYCCKECYKIAMNSHRKQPVKYGVCPICGTNFELNVYNKIYCSDECRKIAYLKNKQEKEIKYKICPTCGKEFELTAYNKIYCSAECRKTAKREKNVKICEYCGKEFEARRYNQKYCCKRCSQDALNKRLRTGFKSKKCLRCGDIFTPNSPVQKYCENCKDIAEKEKKKNTRKGYYSKNKDVILQKNKEYYKKNKDLIKSQRERYKKRRNELRRKKRKNDILYKIIETCRNNLKRCLNSKKDKRTFEILGYTPSQLKQRLEFQFRDGMTWDNHGEFWEIHHKKELCKFNFVLPNGDIDYNEIRIANSLANLQPLTIVEHKIKTSKLLKK